MVSGDNVEDASEYDENDLKNVYWDQGTLGVLRCKQAWRAKIMIFTFQNSIEHIKCSNMVYNCATANQMDKMF